MPLLKKASHADSKMPRSLFCSHLIHEACWAYGHQINQEKYHSAYYDENNSGVESLLTWGTIQMLNEQKNNAMMRYLSLYAELHDTYIDSPLTPEEAKSRGYKAFHGYLGEYGNQAQFSEYISEVVSNECDSNINFDDTEYSSDASSDRSEVTPNGVLESLPYHESDFSDLLRIILEDQQSEVSADTLQTEPSRVAPPQQSGYEASQRVSLFAQPIASGALQHEDALSSVRSHVGGR
jgi:hypothetical protein